MHTRRNIYYVAISHAMKVCVMDFMIKGIELSSEKSDGDSGGFAIGIAGQPRGRGGIGNRDRVNSDKAGLGRKHNKL